MAFSQKTWKDRLVEFAGRRKLTTVSTGDGYEVVDVVRNEGSISQEGDAFSAANMNDLEQRISDTFGGLSFAQDEEGNWGYIPSGADTVTPFSSGLVEYIDSNADQKHLTNDVASASKTYTATSNGTLLIFGTIIYTKSMTSTVTLNEVEVTPTVYHTASNTYIALYSIPVKENDNIQLSFTATNTANYTIVCSYIMVIVK